jgi:hypothetical protein
MSIQAQHVNSGHPGSRAPAPKMSEVVTLTAQVMSSGMAAAACSSLWMALSPWEALSHWRQGNSHLVACPVLSWGACPALVVPWDDALPAGALLLRTSTWERCHAEPRPCSSDTSMVMVMSLATSWFPLIVMADSKGGGCAKGLSWMGVWEG